MQTPWADKPEVPRNARRMEVTGLLLIAWILYGLAGVSYRGPVSLPVEGPASHESAGPIPVRVVGEVHRPGRYRAPAGARVSDAIALAGGATIGADLKRLNLTAGLLPHAALRVPSIEYGFEPLVFINRSAPSELAALSGIGPELARRIVHDRELHGPFLRPPDLLRVSGIGPKKLEAILNQGLVREWGP